EAHHLIAELISQARQTGVSFSDALNKDATISRLRSPAQVAMLLDPVNYTGDAVQTVDRIVRELE
ncbi:MAG: hypothetical protein ABJF69_20640, partial [Anderseniella sp.]